MLCSTRRCTYPMAGTILERSRTPLKQWFFAVFLMSTTRCGISAKQLQGALGVTYKTAWRMFRQIPILIGENIEPMSGTVEIDYCYIGGRAHGKRGRGAENKSTVLGIAQWKYRPLFPWSIFAPGNEFLFEPKGEKSCIFTASGRLRAGPLFKKLGRNRLEATKKHMKEEGGNLRRLLEKGRD